MADFDPDKHRGAQRPNQPAGGRPSSATAIPTVEQMHQMGLVPCSSQPCPCWVDPANLPGRRCLAHERDERRRRQAERFKQRDEQPERYGRRGRRDSRRAA